MIQKDIQQTLLTAQLTPSSAYQTKNKQLQPVLDALWENKSLRLNLQELADLVHLTPTYLSRLLKEEFGIPFSQFYRQLKSHGLNSFFWRQIKQLPKSVKI